MEIKSLFFELLQVAIGNRATLTVMPTSREWTLLFEMSKKQSLVSIAFRGVAILKNKSAENNGLGSPLCITDVDYLEWLGLTFMIVQRNKEVTTVCKEVTKQLEKDGFHSCVLKGQSNLVNYPEELRSKRHGDRFLFQNI